MKSLVLQSNARFSCEERPMPKLRSGEVLVHIAACGLCGSDMLRTMHGGAYHYPLVAGHEFSGVVCEVGEHVRTAKAGNRVAVFPMLPCMECESCRSGHYNLCKHYDYFGSRRDGGFAEYLAVPEWNLVPLPDSLPLEVAALCEPTAVAVHAMRRGGLALGQAVGVSGAGTIGLILSHIAKLAGAEQVFLWDIDAGKVDFSRRMGNENTFNCKEVAVNEAVAQAIGRPLDLVVEGTGSSNGLETCLAALKDRGQLVLMGNPGADTVQLSKAAYSGILRHEIDLHGTWNSDYLSPVRSDWDAAVQLLNADSSWFAQLITHRFALEEGQRYFDMMDQHKEFCCKVMCLINKADS